MNGNYSGALLSSTPLIWTSLRPVGKWQPKRTNVLQQPRGATLATRWSPYCSINRMEIPLEADTGWFWLVGLFSGAACFKILYGIKAPQTTGNYACKLMTPGKLPLLPPNHTIKMFLNLAQYNKTHYEMYCKISWVGVLKFLSKMNR